ncbi:MAG: serine hydrolase domain-containing protein [Gammaproteobacteria bacterium]
MSAKQTLPLLSSQSSDAMAESTQTDRPSSRFLARIVEKAVRDYPVPGIVTLLAGPKTEVTVAAGVRQRGTNVEMERGDSVHIGSCLKAMTATVAARLVEHGLIGWDTTVGQAYPELAGRANPANTTITLEELLAHRSGLTDDIPQELQELALAFQGSGREARTRFLPEYLALPPGAARGSFNYSNFGYALAGGMLERVSGRSYEELLQQELFDPLDMRSAHFGSPGSNDPNIIDAPRGHDINGNVLLPYQQFNPPILAPAGLYSMQLKDWLKFARLQLGLPVEGKYLLSQASLAKLHAPVGGPISETGDRYALGWVIVHINGHELLAHDGSNDAWLSRIVINPSNRRILLQSTNEFSANADKALGEIVSSRKGESLAGRQADAY